MREQSQSAISMLVNSSSKGVEEHSEPMKAKRHRSLPSRAAVSPSRLMSHLHSERVRSKTESSLVPLVVDESEYVVSTHQDLRTPHTSRSPSGQLDHLQEHGLSEPRGLIDAQCLDCTSSSSSKASAKASPNLRQMSKSDPAIKTMMLMRSARKRLLHKAVADSRHEEDVVAAKRIGLIALGIAFRDWRAFCAVSRIYSDASSEVSKSSTSLCTCDSDSFSCSSSSGSSSNASVGSRAAAIMQRQRKDRDLVLLQQCLQGPHLPKRSPWSVSTPTNEAHDATEEEALLKESTSYMSENPDLADDGPGSIPISLHVASMAESCSRGLESRGVQESCSQQSAEQSSLMDLEGQPTETKSLPHSILLSGYLLDKPLARNAVAFWIRSTDLVRGLLISVVLIFTLVGVLSLVAILRLSEAFSCMLCGSNST